MNIYISLYSRSFRAAVAIVIALASVFFVSSASALTIPDCVMGIEDGAFDGDDAISTLSLPSSMKDVGKRAFANCDALAEIYIYSNDIALETEALGLLNEVRFLHAPRLDNIYLYLSIHDEVSYLPLASPEKAKAVLTVAASYLGTPYSQHDCITYVRQCYREALKITYFPASCKPADTEMQKYVPDAVRITEISRLEPGDIICWRDETHAYCTHVGMYVGSGKFIESSYGAGKVRYNYIAATGTGYYTRNFLGAWRII